MVLIHLFLMSPLLHLSRPASTHRLLAVPVRPSPRTISLNSFPLRELLLSQFMTKQLYLTVTNSRTQFDNQVLTVSTHDTITVTKTEYGMSVATTTKTDTVTIPEIVSVTTSETRTITEDHSAFATVTETLTNTKMITNVPPQRQSLRRSQQQ